MVNKDVYCKRCLHSPRLYQCSAVMMLTTHQYSMITFCNVSWIRMETRLSYCCHRLYWRVLEYRTTFFATTIGLYQTCWLIDMASWRPLACYVFTEIKLASCLNYGFCSFNVPRSSAVAERPRDASCHWTLKNKIMKVSQNLRFWLKISICQSSMVHEGCSVHCPTRVGKLEASAVCWRESARRVQLSGYQAAADCVQRLAVDDLVLSQEDKPKRHRSAREISHETAIVRTSVHRIIHRDL